MHIHCMRGRTTVHTLQQHSQTDCGQESHAIHLHGHSYFVAAVGYGGYDTSSGFVTSSNRSLSCQADENDIIVATSVCSSFV